jgi:hypothetical protein
MPRFKKIPRNIRYYLAFPPVFTARERSFVTVSHRRVILAIILGAVAAAILL